MGPGKHEWTLLPTNTAADEVILVHDVFSRHATGRQGEVPAPRVHPSLHPRPLFPLGDDLPPFPLREPQDDRAARDLSCRSYEPTFLGSGGGVWCAWVPPTEWRLPGHRPSGSHYNPFLPLHISPSPRRLGRARCSDTRFEQTPVLCATGSVRQCRFVVVICGSFCCYFCGRDLRLYTRICMYIVYSVVTLVL